ncbi:MAG TPA: hypothetical protein VKA60_13270 [Blastocatellia bacterium]|nr:hypothetical protein [Blastocatellia bacterium]
MQELNIPCVKFPELPEIPNVQLIGGVELNGFLDFSNGMPTDCTATFSLLQQLGPALAGLAPILNILAVLKALADFATNPLFKGPDLIAAINKIAGMFIALTPAGIAITIKGVLNLIINFLSCFLSQMQAAIDFQAKIALIQAQANSDPSLSSPVLLASLTCASANAEVAMQQAMGALGPIKPLLDVVNIIGGIAGLTLEMPDMSTSGGAEASHTIAKMNEVINSLKLVLANLPG